MTLFLENVNLFSQIRVDERNRQTDRITVAIPRFALKCIARENGRAKR